MQRGRVWQVLSAVVLLAALALAGVGLHVQQTRARHEVVTRFDARGVLAASFVATFGQDLLNCERVSASAVLSGDVPSSASFLDVVRVFGFSAAVLLDDRGRVLDIYPAAPARIGTELASGSPHLASAVGGTPAVSQTVGTAAGGQSILAFATPYDTPSGRRVLSGAYPVGATPLGGYLEHILVTPGARVLLVDGNGKVLAGQTPLGGTDRTLATGDPSLSAALGRAGRGTYQQDGVGEVYSSHPVEGTAWTAIVVAPQDALLASIQGPIRWMPWVLLAVLGLLAALALCAAWWLVAGRGHLQKANSELDRLAHRDLLTGLSNRRHIEVVLRDLVRSGTPVCVLMIDVDHFKRINDTFGHAAGDLALAHVADILRATLRTQDELGRWGGEEFLAVLPGARLADAEGAGQRLLGALCDRAISLTPTDDVVLSASIGAAEARPGELVDVVLLRADRALYRAKELGRARVLAAP